MRFFRPPLISRLLYRDAIFATGKNDNSVCLSFDDGPHPATTPLLLDTLEKFGVNAIFFCNGNAAEKFPDLITKIKEKGHLIGNHGYNHLNGLKTSFSEYVDNCEKGALVTSDKLFRPPYGKITFRQYLHLSKKYKIVMWDLISYDFDKELVPEKVLSIIIRKSRRGSIIVMHDKPSACAVTILEETIKTLIDKGFCFSLPKVIG